MWIIPVSCELQKSLSALLFPCKCAKRDKLHAVEYHGSFSSAALVAVGLSHMEIKVNITSDGGLWSLSKFHGVHCRDLTWFLFSLLALRELNGSYILETFICAWGSGDCLLFSGIM